MIDKIKRYYWQQWPYDWRPGQAWYRLKCFVWHRYTTVKPRNMAHTWCDRCELLPHMMFEILQQFIEEECSPGHIEWYGEYGHKLDNGKYVMDEMKDLAHWWAVVWSKEQQEINDIFWKEAEKHSPVDTFKPCEDNKHLVVWVSTFANDDDRDIYKLCRCACNKLERSMEAEKTARLHRLVTVIPYMWT